MAKQHDDREIDALKPIPLHSLCIGERGRIVKNRAKGALGRRLIDLGLIPGTDIKVLRRGPLGDPTAYLFRGTTIALRREDAASISVQPESTD